MKKLLQNALIICGLTSSLDATAQSPAPAKSNGFHYKGYHFANEMWPFFEHDNITFTPRTRDNGDTLVVVANADTSHMKDCCLGACCEMRDVQLSMVLGYAGQDRSHGPEDVFEMHSTKGSQHITITTSRTAGTARLIAFQDGCPARATLSIPTKDIPHYFRAHGMGIGGMECK